MLAFVHIPKTAGTTLHKILTHQISRNHTVIHHDTRGPLDSETLDRWKSGDIRLIVGHFSVGVHRIDPSVRYVTCLREPVARLLSHYQHAKSDPAHYLHRPLVDGRMSPADYVTSGLSGELSNGMTRMLAGVEDFHHSPVTRETLTLARENLAEHFDSILLSEQFDSGALLLAGQHDWPPPYYIRRKTGHYPGGKPVLPSEDRARIEAHNTCDLDLYQWARERFRFLASTHRDLDTRTAAFQQANSRIGLPVFLARELRRRLQHFPPKSVWTP